MRVASAVFSLLAFFAIPVRGQDLASLQQGARIRVETGQGGGKVGTYVGLTEDSLRFFREGATPAARAIYLGDVKRVDVSRGRSRAKGLLIGSLIGTAIGVGAGALLGAATYSEDQSGWCIIACSRGETAALTGALIGAGGLIVGSIYGASKGSEVWEPVPIRGK